MIGGPSTRRDFKIMYIDFYHYSPSVLLGRTTLMMFVYHVRVSQKIHKAIKKNWGQLCFEKRHFGSHGLPHLLNTFSRKAYYSTRGVL